MKTIPLHDRVLVTRNSEYFLRNGICVGVRASGSDENDVDHPALGKRLAGGIRWPAGDGPLSFHEHEPEVGDRVCFQGDVVTSPLQVVRAA